MAWDGLVGTDIRYWSSDVESRRFGIRIGRVVVGYDATPSGAIEAQLHTVVAGAKDDLLVVRYPAAYTKLGAVLADCGRRVIPADVLTYWEIQAEQLAQETPADSTLEVHAGSSDRASRAALETVLLDSFRGYGNHYTANPALDPELALAGYLEWAMGAFERNPDDVLLLIHDGVPVGAATVVPGDGHLEIELAGLVGASQGRGWYATLLAGVGHEAARRGLPRVVISTQISNVRVQRAWVNVGMKPYAAVTTVHASL